MYCELIDHFKISEAQMWSWANAACDNKKTRAVSITAFLKSSPWWIFINTLNLLKNMTDYLSQHYNNDCPQQLFELGEDKTSSPNTDYFTAVIKLNGSLGHIIHNL